jgi:hypothetical protein
MREQRARLSRHAEVAKAMDYMLKRWKAFTRFLDDGRICPTNNAAERELRGVALGRKAWLFAGSDRGGERAAAMYSLLATAKLNRVDPRAWLADVLARIADHPASRLQELLPWNWRKQDQRHRRRVMFGHCGVRPFRTRRRLVFAPSPSGVCGRSTCAPVVARMSGGTAVRAKASPLRSG